jgi:hypothetical protein
MVGISLLAVLASLPVVVQTFAPDGWPVQNNTNLRYGDVTRLDFSLPSNCTDQEGVTACTTFCLKTSACAAWVYVRSGHRCAIKGYHTGWCVNNRYDADTISGIRPGVNASNCSAPTPPAPAPPAGMWRLPAIDWKARGVVGPTHEYAVRAFDVVFWEPEGKWYLYCDLVLYSDADCPASYGSEIGVRATAPF